MCLPLSVGNTGFHSGFSSGTQLPQRRHLRQESKDEVEQEATRKRLQGLEADVKRLQEKIALQKREEELRKQVEALRKPERFEL